MSSQVKMTVNMSVDSEASIEDLEELYNALENWLVDYKAQGKTNYLVARVGAVRFIVKPDTLR